MNKHKKFSKKIAILGISMSLAVAYACQTETNPSNLSSKVSTVPNVITANQQINNSLVTSRDWTFDRVANRVNYKSFSVKSASDSLKPDVRPDENLIDNSKVISNTNAVLTGRVSVEVDASGDPTGNLQGNLTSFQTELKVGDKIVLDNTGEVFTVVSFPTPVPTPTPSESATTTEAEATPSPLLGISPVPTKTTKDSVFKIYVNKNSRGKSFGSTTIYPAMDLNAAGTADDVLYYTANNTTGSNLFAVGSDGKTLWEQKLSGNFANCMPTFSIPSDPLITQKTYLGKKLLYVISKEGDLYCLNTDGQVASSVKINDKFKSSVWVDANDANSDYVYAASENGNLYRFKLDFSNPQTRSFSLTYSVKVADTSFFAPPVLNNSSLYLGGENGILYEIIPNSGDASRLWDLSQYPKNGGAKILAPVVITSQNYVLASSGGYLFRIIGSTVTQSPLLELKEGLNSRNKPYGTVFATSGDYPSGNIMSAPLLDPADTSTAYISNGNAVFQIDYSSIDLFKNSAVYGVSMSGRLTAGDTGLNAMGNGGLAISTPNLGGARKLAMVDFNTNKNTSPFINFFNLPLSSSTDTLARYMPINEFDSSGYPISGMNSSSISDGAGNVYFSLNNGTVNVLATP